ncbi:TspO/MBR family protein [Algibacter miyuki]|uniref:TspO/MBR family protein n=1 Tax=Algibacter miyuki TaxID=1306933 RepID=A0ABV5GX12_9FLAO|nr:TspO/MBR family protein [Algibacter miyuki]MDN3666103.1 TspO/MBR family protein [Algibacter miyuki]
MENNKIIRFVLFLCFNILALGIGVLIMSDGPQSAWYTSLNKAPWTPDNWVFGAAWTCIMVAFSVYMTALTYRFPFTHHPLIKLYALQWVLNVLWNFLFFNQHLAILGLINITALWLLIGYFTFNYIKTLKYYTLFIAPYLIWITIATSLNAYIVFNN